MTRSDNKKPIPNPITEQTIREYVDAVSFTRALEYHNQGMIFEARVEGESRLKARCDGSSGGPYRVAATIDQGEIVDSLCSCPVGAFCKHIAALLLAWKDRPETFGEAEDLDTILERMSQEELVELVKQMVEREPELESIVAVPISRRGKAERGD